MFEFYGFLIRVVRAEVGLTVMLFENANDTDPYCAAGLLSTELDLYSESEIIQLSEMDPARFSGGKKVRNLYTKSRRQNHDQIIQIPDGRIQA